MTLVLILLGYWTIRLTRGRRLLHWHADAVHLIRTDRRAEHLRIFWQENQVKDPVITTIRMTNVGSLDVGSDAFDQDRPITFRFEGDVIALLEASPDTEELVPIALNGRGLAVGPGLVKRGVAVTAAVLTDGPTEVTPISPLQNVRLIAASAERSDRYTARQNGLTLESRVGLGIALLLVMVMASSAPWWWSALFGGAPTQPGSTSVAQMVGGCGSFEVFAQNRWPPVGATVRASPSVLAPGTYSAVGNQVLSVNGWVHGQAAYPINEPPWNSDVWFHLADGSGWVSFAGVRAAPTSLDPTGTSPNGGNPAPTASNCEGEVKSN